MATFWRTFVVLCVASPLVGSSAIAKRNPIKPVQPIISGGIRYSAEGDAGNHYIVATDTSSDRRLWKVKVYHNHIKMWEEIDVQWVPITKLELLDNSLHIKDEKSRCYSVDLVSKRVKKQQCNGALL